MSTTYMRLLASALVAIANILGFDLDEGFAFELLSILLVTAITIRELISRYDLGGIKWWGKRE